MPATAYVSDGRTITANSPDAVAVRLLYEVERANPGRSFAMTSPDGRVCYHVFVARNGLLATYPEAVDPTIKPLREASYDTRILMREARLESMRLLSIALVHHSRFPLYYELRQALEAEQDEWAEFARTFTPRRIYNLSRSI